MSDCVWKGPQDILDKIPLHSAPEYRDNRKIARLFHTRILEIVNADWTDYQRTLIKLKQNPDPTWNNTHDRAQKLYTLLFNSRLSDGNWSSIR
jgi:hypothetical protein